MKNKKGFTLIELLIVIGIIAILAAAVIVAINPGQQFAQARDASRERNLNSVYNALISYQVYNHGTWGNLTIPAELTEICNTNPEEYTCGDLVDLSELTTEGFLSSIPVDPQGSVSEAYDGTGYFISTGSVTLLSYNAETRPIAFGRTTPQVVTVSVDQLGDFEWEFTGELTSFGADFEAEVWFEYGYGLASNGYGASSLLASLSPVIAAVPEPEEEDIELETTDPVTITSTGEFQETADGFPDEETHYFRAVAENQFGRIYGDIMIIE